MAYTEIVLLIIVVGSFSFILERIIKIKFKQLNNKIDFLIEQTGELYPPRKNISHKVEKLLIKKELKSAHNLLKNEYNCSDEQATSLIEIIIEEYDNKQNNAFPIDK